VNHRTFRLFLVAYVGSYNPAPRVASDLATNILAEVKAGNRWVIARRRMPLHLDKVNGLIDGILDLRPIDIWPIQNSASVDLIPGKTDVAPDSPLFYYNYKEVGDFPGAAAGLSQKEIMTRLLKAVGPLVTPIL